MIKFPDARQQVHSSCHCYLKLHATTFSRIAKNINLLGRSLQSHLPLFVQQQQQERVPYSKESVDKISCYKNHYRFSSSTVNAIPCEK